MLVKKDLNKKIKIIFMNSKNFFAISKLKIIILFLFVVLFFLVIFSSILSSDKGITMIISPAHFLPLNLSSDYWLTSVIVFFVIDVVYWFLLACLIDWIYYNFGKK